MNPGHHKFDENKRPIQANFAEQNGHMQMPVSLCKLNFYVPNYVNLRSQGFLLKMIQR
jgi:hypothetical protein